MNHRALIVGASGIVGRALAERLLLLNFEVCANGVRCNANRVR
ncbi:hypothetical protein [Burkholderia cenocepacia]|nr:hypothetical protein [Burkholderia cenocepacia]